MLRFALGPRWLLGHAVVVTVVAVCVGLGFWQLRRLDERRELNALVEQRLAAPVVPLDHLLPLGPQAAYRRVTVSGRYDPSLEVVLLGRGLPDRPGHRVLTPLVTDHGTLAVDRGWVPRDMDRPPLDDAAPPRGEIGVTGVLLPSEGRGPPGDVAALPRADLGVLAGRFPQPLLALYLLAELHDTHGVRFQLPVLAPLPDPDEGPHLAYAVQWFLFAAVASGGWTVLVVRSNSRLGSREPGT